MADLVPSTDATRLREEGNELHKLGKLSAAATKYEKASTAADGTNPLPSSNLSAVLFEMGIHLESIHAANKALERGQYLDERVQQRLRT